MSLFIYLFCCCCCCAVLLLATENAHQITWTPTWSLHAAPRSRRAVLRTVRVFRRSVATYASNSMPTIWSPILIGSGEGSEPEWNETFIFTVSDDTTPQLHLKIMDSDVTDDDFVGEATWVPRPGIFAPVCTGLHYSLPNPRPLRSAQTSVHESMPLNFQLRFICRLKRAWLLCLCLYYTSQLSASPWRLCFRKAAFLRQLTQSSRRRNTAERSSLHSPSLQQWYVPRNVLAAANSHAMPR
jgi:hypothetical protein